MSKLLYGISVVKKREREREKGGKCSSEREVFIGEGGVHWRGRKRHPEHPWEWGRCDECMQLSVGCPDSAGVFCAVKVASPSGYHLLSSMTPATQTAMGDNT